MYESRDPKANQQTAQERAPVRRELLQCVAQALRESPPGPDPTAVAPNGTVVKMMASIDTFFGDVFASHGPPKYEAPKVRKNPALARREKGGTLFGQPARYNTDTNEIEYSPDYLKTIHDLFSNYEVAIALAHEVGHHVQLLLNKKFVEGKEKDWELQADVLSGAYMASVGMPLLEKDEAELLRFYQIVGGNDPTHGTPEERLAAFKDGYLNGVPADLFGP